MKLSKVFSVVMIAVMLLGSLSNIAFASSITIGNISFNEDTGSNAATAVGTVGGRILGTIRTVGTIAAIITLIILGIKYMMGSAEEKAEYKKTLMPYVIGAILVLASVNIVNWVFGAASGFFD